ncbi:isochorismatase family protein [Salinirubellus salinus]|uniref:Isochorismatase family protein n=1 Tax=Salinirubellus salinus TaxID=1364945 RepID=A0A9E7R2R2_9EURY|nr:isochorismatase family protein [Salinirubellus salinus]UWM54491.1 isochorismatase family protein [Salinirubellus salinus]
MPERPWDSLLSDRDREVIEAAGYDEAGASNWDTRGVGDRPMLLVVDVQRVTVGADVPITEAVEESRIAMGEVAHRALEHLVPFVEFVREQGIPVAHTRVVPPAYDPDDPEVQIVDALAPLDDEPVVDKRYASAFFGTDLVSRLVRADVDTLVVVGDTTSGCLRATVVDAQQFGFKVVVPEECVFDRVDLSHRASLLDMWMKYADVRPTSEVRELLAGES